MSLLLVLGIALVGLAATLLANQRRDVAIAVGILALAALTVASLLLDHASVTLAGVTLVPGPFARIFLVLGAFTGLTLSVIGLAAGWTGNLPAATLATLAALGLALSATDPLVAIAAGAAAGLPGVLVALRGPGPGRPLESALRHARSVAIGAALAILAAALVGRAVGGAAGGVLSAAYLALALAVAIRLGAIPFHLPAARLARSAPAIGLPLLLAWAPAGLAAVALAWTDGLIAPLALPLGLERGLIVAVGALSLVFGAAAAWLAEDVERAVGYLTLQGTGYLLLGMAALDPAAWQPAHTWLIGFVLATTALFAWAVALRAAFGTGRIEALDGWARRAPLLGLTLAAIVVAVVGWPGSPILDARLSLVRLAVGGPLGGVLVLAGLASLATFARFGLAGLRPVGPAVAGGVGERPQRPSRPATGPLPVRARLRAAALTAREIWRLDRVLIAAVLALVLASTGLIASAGGLGVDQASKAPAPVALPGEPVPFTPGQVGP